MSRSRQVLYYSWLHACQISQEEFNGKKRLFLFLDILKCYIKYGMWSNLYLKEQFWTLNTDDRGQIGNSYSQANQKREEWVKDFYDNRKFLAKWSKYDIETSAAKRGKRNDAYRKRYNMGEGSIVEYGVEFSRQHHLPGTIKIGSHVLFAKNVFIDYSGDVIIDDNVKIAAGVSMESHHRDLEAYQKGKDVNIPTPTYL